MIVPTIPVQVEAQEPEQSGGWDSRYSYRVDYGNGTHISTFSFGPQVFWDQDASDWNELKFEDLGDGYLLENSMITAYVYEWYTVFYDPDNQRVSVDDERWIVEVYNDKKEKWREVDLYAPSLSYSNNATHLTVTRNFNCAEGEFNVTYILWQGSRLKHDTSFKSRMEGIQQFRVTMKMAGIRSDKIKYKDGSATITGENHIISPFFVIGENNTNLVLSEYLWSLGEVNETTDEWSPTTLKDIVLDVHAQGSKVDIIIGNYTLAENERLEIDPATDTWQVGSSSNDVCWVGETGDLWGPLSNYAQGLTSAHNNAGYTTASTRKYKYSGMRWTSITIPQGATINSASLEGRCNQGDSGGYTRIYGEDEDTTSAFTNDVPNFRARPRTSAYLNWDPGAWVSGTWYTSPDIKTIIQEIVDRPSWDGNSIVLFRGWRTNSDVAQRFYSYDSSSESAPKLHVTYTSVSAPSVTTLSATLVEETTANPRGQVTDTGGENPTRYIDYGETPGGGGQAVSKYLVVTDGDDTGLRSKGQQKIIYSSDKSKIWLFYSRDGGRLVVLQSIDDGESWSSVYTSPADHAYVFALKDSSNYIHLVLREEVNDFTEHWKSQNVDDPTSWTIVDSQICDGVASGSAGAGIAPNNNIHVILDRTSNHQLYYVYYNGAVWSAPLQITEGGASSYQERWSRVTVDSSGHLHIPVSVWGGSNYVKLGYIKYDGVNWKKADGTTYSLPIDLTSEIEDVTTGNSVRPKSPNLHVDDSNYPMILVQQNKVGDSTFGEAVHFYRWTGSSWSFVIVDNNTNREFRACGMIKNSVNDDELLIVLTAREELTETYHNAAYYYSDDKGATWGSIQYVTTDAETFSEHYNFHGVHLLAEPDFIWATQRGQTSAESIFFIEVKIGDGYLYSKNCGVGGTGIYNSDLTGLTPGEKYYYRARVVNTGGTGYGSEMTFITKPNGPSSLNAYSPTDTQISLSWTKGTGAYYTYVIRKVGSYPANLGDGVQVYANTGSGTTDSSLSPGVHYFYRAWSRAYDGGWGPYSDGYSSDAEYTKPGNPSALSATAVGETQIDLAWTKGTGGDKTHIRRKIGSYPTSISDGDQAYFDTGVSKEDTGLEGGNDYYYRGWAYDTDSGYYSSGYTEDWDRTPQTHETEVSQSLSLASDSYRIWSTGRTLSQGMTLTSEGQRTLGAQRELSQSFSWSGVSYRSCIFNREGMQGVSLSAEGYRMLGALRIPTQSLTLTGVMLRQVDAGRNPVQGLTLTSSSSRLWQLLKTVEQTLSVTPTAGREWSLMRVFTQGISTTFNGNRILTALRGLSQIISTGFNAERLLTAIRTPAQGLSMTSGISRTWSTMRVITQSITTAFNAERLWILMRTASQGMSLSFNGNRVLTAVRELSQTITATVSADRVLAAIRTLVQSLDMTSSIGRTWSTTRVLTQAITSTFNTERLWNLMRGFSQGVSLTFNGDRILTAVRGLSQGISASFNGERMVALIRMASQGMTTSFGTGRLWSTTRTMFQAVSISSNTGRLWSTLRSVSQGISTTFNGERVLTALRGLAQGLSLTFNGERVVNLIRSASQTISTSLDTFRSWTLLKTVSQTVSLGLDTDRYWVTFRLLTQTISTAFNGKRIWSMMREVTQGISLTLNGERLLAAIRIVSQGITSTFNVNRVWSTSRTITQGITAVFNSGRLWSLSRTVSQSISTTFDSLRYGGFIREVSQNLFLVSSAFGKKFIHFIERTVSLMVETSFNAIREWSLLRTIAQSLTANFNAERLWTLLRTTSQTLGISFNALREWSLMRELSQSITSSFESVRELNLLRLVAQSLDINLNAERGWTLLRTLTQTVEASFESGRLWTALRVASQSITAGFNADRGWTLLRTLTQPLTASFNAGRWWMQVRIVTQTISTSFNSVRFWTAFRGISQTITTALSADRIFTAIRQASQNIAFNSGTERLATFLRVIAQLITMSSETLRTWSLSRTLGQGLSFASSIFVKLTKFIPPPEEFFRALSMGIAFVSNSIRNWGQNRMISQGISFLSNSIRQWSLSRAFTQGLSLVSEARTFMGIMKMVGVSLSLGFVANLCLFFSMLNEFNVSIIMLNMLTLLATGMFLGRGREVAWGAVSTFLWFVTAAATVLDNPSNWVPARVYGMIGIILIVLVFIRAIRGLNPEDQYFGEWDDE